VQDLCGLGNQSPVSLLPFQIKLLLAVKFVT